MGTAHAAHSVLGRLLVLSCFLFNLMTDRLICNRRYILLAVTTTSSWLLLNYKVPADPPKGRAALWRKIKGMGAVHLQSGVCLLPKTDDHLRRLNPIHQSPGLNT